MSKKIFFWIIFCASIAHSNTSSAWFNSPGSLSKDNDLHWPTELKRFEGFIEGNVIYGRASMLRLPRTVKKMVERMTTNSDGEVIVVSEEDSEVVFDLTPVQHKSTLAPAVILLHSCGGFGGKNLIDLTRWTKLLTENGFVVLTMDHLTARNVKDNCWGKRRQVTKERLVKDVFDAAEHLASLPTIDKTQIFTLGFSLGAMTGGVVAGTSYGSDYEGKPHPRAVAGLYGGCDFSGEVWLDGTETLPVLWLMGSADSEAPATPCLNAVKRLKDKNNSSDWHLYEGASHCWDCQALNGYVQDAPNGNKETYRYNEAYTRDSERRVLEFLRKFD